MENIMVVALKQTVQHCVDVWHVKQQALRCMFERSGVNWHKRDKVITAQF